jgi:hypothetical protein
MFTMRGASNLLQAKGTIILIPGNIGHTAYEIKGQEEGASYGQ